MVQDPALAAAPQTTAPLVNYERPDGANVTTASTVIVAANDDRAWVTITNLTTEAIYLAVGDHGAIVEKGLTLLSEGSERTIDDNTGRVFAIHAGSGNKAVAIMEATKA